MAMLAQFVAQVDGSGRRQFGEQYYDSAATESNGTATVLAFPGLTVQADGTVSRAVTGTASFELAGLNVSGTGTTAGAVEGTGSFNVTGIGFSGVSALSPIGTGSVNFTGIALEGVGQVIGVTEGTGTVALAGVTATGTGKVTSTIEGTGVAALTGFGSEADGSAILLVSEGEGSFGFSGIEINGYGDTWKRLTYVRPDPWQLPVVVSPDSVRICGIDGSTARLPGDPDFDNATLSATASLFGVILGWTYPLVNPWAVAYWIIYRSRTPNFVFAQPIARVSGSSYFDPIDDFEVGDTYYYWIRPYSINGLEGPLTGPAQAVLQPFVQNLIDLLVGRLSESQLNADLRAEIGRITDLISSLDAIEQDRLFGEQVFTDLLDQLKADLDDIDTLVATEVVERITADRAFAARLDVMLAQLNEAKAAIITEEYVVATANFAAAGAIQTIQASLDNLGYATVQEVSQVEANIEEGLKAEWMIKAQVNRGDGKPVIAGIGVYAGSDNDGVATSEVIILADRFAVATASFPDVFPFIIDQVNGQNVIALNGKALIPDASITNAMIENFIGSIDYQPGVSGWGIWKDHPEKGAYIEANNIMARGDIEATSIKANTANIVDTLMLQNSVLFIPRSFGGWKRGFYSQTGHQVGTTNFNIGRLTPERSGGIATVHIQAQATVYPGGDNQYRTTVLEVRKNGQVIAEAAGSIRDGGISIACMTATTVRERTLENFSLHVRIKESSGRNLNVVTGALIQGIKK